MGFILPRVFACCLCLTLRTGCLIIGYFSLGLASLFLIVTSIFLATIVHYVQNHVTYTTNATTEHSPEEIQRQAVNLYIILGCLMAVFLYYAVISVLLLVGTHRNSTRLMKWFTKMGLALFVMTIAMVIVSYIFLGLSGALPLLAWSLLIFYFLVVVRSTYLEIEEADKTPPLEMNRLFIGQAYS